MTRDQKLTAIEKIWNKHTTRHHNMIATMLPHTNFKAFMDELLDFFDHEYPYPNDLKLTDVREAVKEVLKDDSK